MPSLSAYSSSLDYSYAPGVFPSMECLLSRPEKVRRLLVHSSAAGREGVDKLRALAEAHNIRIEEADRAQGYSESRNKEAFPGYSVQDHGEEAD